MKKAYFLVVLILIVLIVKDRYFNKTWLNRIDNMTFARIPAGELEATIKNSVGKDSAITVFMDSDFMMSTTEVSVGQFKKFVEKTGYITSAEKDSNRYTWRSPGFEQDDSHPVVFVSDTDAQAYCDWANVEIPSETEWLYACRAGTNTKFFWGDSLNDDYVWYRMNTNGSGTRPVGTQEPNPWGLYNMVGNVQEFVMLCDKVPGSRGSSWVRCDSYKHRNGYIVQNLIAMSVAPHLTKGENGERDIPWYEDNRGIRCVKRSSKQDN